jgi:hypothetical protein
VRGGEGELAYNAVSHREVTEAQGGRNEESMLEHVQESICGRLGQKTPVWGVEATDREAQCIHCLEIGPPARGHLTGKIVCDRQSKWGVGVLSPALGAGCLCSAAPRGLRQVLPSEKQTGLLWVGSPLSYTVHSEPHKQPQFWRGLRQFLACQPNAGCWGLDAGEL